MQQINYSIEEDSLGKFLKVKLDINLYPIASIMRSTYWFTDKYFLFLSWEDLEHKKLNIFFRGKEALSDQTLLAVAGEFLNSVLDQTIRAQIEEETKTIKSVIVKRAFAEGLSREEQQFISNM